MAVLGQALNHEDARIAIKAAEVLLDRGWGKPTQPLSGASDEPPINHSITVIYGA